MIPRDPPVPAARETGIEDLVPLRDQAYLLARRILRDAADAEDAVQQAFLLALRAESRPPPGEGRCRWFFVIVANAARQHHLRRRTRRRQEVQGLKELPVPTPLRLEADPALAAAVASAMERLGDRDRAALAARFELGLSYEAAAAVLDMPQARVRLHVSRGLERLRRLLKRHGLTMDAAGVSGVLGAAALPPMSPAGQAAIAAIVQGRPPAMPLLPPAHPPRLAPGVVVAALAAGLAVALAAFLRPTPAPLPPIPRTDPAPAPVPPPAASPAALAAMVVSLEERAETLRSRAADLGLRVGVRAGTALWHPFPLSATLPLTIAAEPAQRVGSLLGEPQVADAALIVWGHLPEATLRTLADQAHAADPARRAAAIETLADAGDPRGYATVVLAMQDPAPEVRDIALDGMRRCGPALRVSVPVGAVIGAVAPLVLAPPPGWRAAAVADVLAMAGPEAEGVRRQFARAVPALAPRLAFAACLASVREGPALLAQLDTWTEVQITRALGAGAPPTAADAALLERWLQAAIGAIGIPPAWTYEEPARARIAGEGLDLPQPDRWAMAIGLAMRAGDQHLSAALLRCAERAAAELGARTPTPAALQEPALDLQPLMPTQLLALRTALALGYARAPAGVATLVRLVADHSQPDVARVALWALSEVRNTDASSAIAGALADPLLRIPAAQALADAANPTGLALLTAAVRAGNPAAHAAARRLEWLPRRWTAWRCGASPAPTHLAAVAALTGALAGDPDAALLPQLATTPQDLPVAVLAHLALLGMLAPLPAPERLGLLAQLDRQPGAWGQVGRTMPRTPADAGAWRYRWSNGRTCAIAIMPTPGVVQEARVVEREPDGRLIVRYLAAAARDAQGTLEIAAMHALLSGPRAGDWAPESMAVPRQGRMELVDDGGSRQTAEPVLDPTATSPAPGPAHPASGGF